MLCSGDDGDDKILLNNSSTHPVYPVEPVYGRSVKVFQDMN